MNIELNKVHHSDCLDFLKTLPDNSVDSIITDPPAGIKFMGKEWDSNKGGRKEWILWLESVMVECYRVLKFGGHGLVWALPRTSHWTATALEDAGFEIRDKIYHMFGSGFPKSHNISKEIDKKYGATREVVGNSQWYGRNPNGRKNSTQDRNYGVDTRTDAECNVITKPATPEAELFDGFGTALKPAVEEWILIRKPIEKGLTIAENCIKWGTGALNLDKCRIDTRESNQSKGAKYTSNTYGSINVEFELNKYPKELGRFPSNLILDDSDEVKEEFDKYGIRKSGSKTKIYEYKNSGFSFGKPTGTTNSIYPENEGLVTRFFYCAKASVQDREEGLNINKNQSQFRKNNHPTVKNTQLMCYLCRLITPPKGIILDPFAGSGSTGKAAILEDFQFIGCELYGNHVEIANARMKHAIENKEELIKKYTKQVDVILPKVKNTTKKPDLF